MVRNQQVYLKNPLPQSCMLVSSSDVDCTDMVILAWCCLSLSLGCRRYVSTSMSGIVLYMIIYLISFPLLSLLYGTVSPFLGNLSLLSYSYPGVFFNLLPSFESSAIAEGIALFSHDT